MKNKLIQNKQKSNKRNTYFQSARSDVTASRDSATGLGSDDEDDELAAALDMHWYGICIGVDLGFWVLFTLLIIL